MSNHYNDVHCPRCRTRHTVFYERCDIGMAGDSIWSAPFVDSIDIPDVEDCRKCGAKLDEDAYGTVKEQEAARPKAKKFITMFYTNPLY